MRKLLFLFICSGIIYSKPDSNINILLKNKIEEGLIGEPQMIHITNHDSTIPKFKFLKSSGGMLFDLCIHDFDMLTFEPDEPVDAVVFCESFHHCDNPILLVEKMSKYVKPNGKLFFFGEPVTIFPVPWGVRLDGQSIWAAREHGWLELGFNTAFFYDLLRRNNWELKSFKSNVLYSARAIVASRI